MTDRKSMTLEQLAFDYNTLQMLADRAVSASQSKRHDSTASAVLAELRRRDEREKRLVEALRRAVDDALGDNWKLAAQAALAEYQP